MTRIILAETLSERTVSALRDSLLGIAVVFSALIILWVSVELFHFIYARATGKKKKAEGPEPVRSAGTEPVPEQETDNGAAIAAAITAALSVYLEKPASAFRVVSFRKTGASAHWNSK